MFIKKSHQYHTAVDEATSTILLLPENRLRAGSPVQDEGPDDDLEEGVLVRKRPNASSQAHLRFRPPAYRAAGRAVPRINLLAEAAEKELQCPCRRRRWALELEVDFSDSCMEKLSNSADVPLTWKAR